MATSTIQTPLQVSPTVRLASLSSFRNSSSLSFDSQFRCSSLAFPSISLKPFAAVKFRNRSLIVASVVKNLSESDLVPALSTPDEIQVKFPSDSGVYAVYDKNNDLQFIGISRNIAGSILNHVKSLSELCSSVKVGVVDDPDRNALTQAWKLWMEEHIKATGKIPPGNESGNSTWVRQPPKKKSDLRLTPGRHVQLTVPVEELIDRLVKENKVVAFIKGSRNAPRCGFSQRVVSILESAGADYESVDVLDEEYNYGLRETMKKYSNWPTFPQVFVGGELVGGCDILSSMHERGELASLLKN